MKKFYIKGSLLLLIVALLVILNAIFISADPAINWPINVPRSLSATLGEIRGFSLHQGLDIKTKGRKGYPIFAAASGKLSRIISKENGYGKAIFIDHTKEIQTVYGHLDSFEEGKHNLSSLVKTLKILYNNNFLNFKILNNNPYYKKDEKIAYAGETGSGFPHLHFEIREKKDYQNPLDYIHIKDISSPVIESIFLCIEKNNATVYEKKINVKKSWGTYRPSENPIEIDDAEKIFFKISCYDRVGAKNRVSIYRIKAYEDNKTLFELAFDSLNNNDIKYGPFIYDKSKSTIKGGVSYVYILCRKENNHYTGIKSSKNGYINLNKSEKNIKIEVSDFAGNNAVLKFSVRKKNILKDHTEGYVEIKKGREFHISNKKKDIQVIIHGDSLYSDTLFKIKDAKSQKRIRKINKSYKIKKEDIYKIISILPNDNIYKNPIQINFKRPKNLSRSEVHNLLIYKFFEGKKPEPVETYYKLSKKIFSTKSNTGGYFALIRDKTPPKIFLPPTFEFCEDKNIYRMIRLYTSDNLSKINKNSIECIIDGEILPYKFDTDRKWIEVTLPVKIISQGTHHIFVKVGDKSNNYSTFSNLLIF